ncbi:MAG: GlpM family protein, partial [Desulfuromonadales bacterium]|nr:GlpM family protein [Desulfuromonadales bacterium]
LTKTRFSYLAGLAPLFPTFALFAHFLSYQQAGVTGLKVVAYFGLFSILPYAFYLLTIIFLIDRTGFSQTISIALCVWLFTAMAIIFTWNQYKISEMI